MEGLAGQSIKGYKLLERIGAGGFGAVYRAHQSTVGREVAIKIILPGFTNHPDFIRRFETEAQLIARLEHLHIAPLHDYWRDPTGAYLVMRYLRGGSLRNALQQGPYNLEEAATLLDQVSSALSVAHSHGVVHRDIKPENILLDEDGNAYLADFGIAKEFGVRTTAVTAKDALVGSPDYLAPEQARSEDVTPRTDIYSLGVVLYEMLAGEHPFPDLSPVERLFKHINDPLPEIATLDRDISKAVNAVVQKATAKNPGKRYDDARAMAVDFREAAGLSATQSARSLVELLTPREQEVLKLVVEGKSNREIAEKLTIELGTVKWYVTRIYKKLNVRSRVQAIVRARELNLIVDGMVATSAATGVLADLPEPENPYKGLKAFQVADERQFYGREKLIRKVIQRLQESGEHARFLAIVGPSGSGKSSLVRAGLIPALWRGELPSSEKWFIADMIPGSHPLDELEVALLKVASEQPADFAEQLRRDGRGLHRAAQLILPDDGSELLLVVDQFEELFTLVEDQESRTHFLDLIVNAVDDPRSQVRVIVTLRADFYDRPLQYPAFGKLVQHRIETVLPLSVEELERAIARPAEGVGVSFEEGLVAAIVDDVHYQPGGLPLMQYALTELFDARTNHTLTHEAYREIGGSTGALAKRADELYRELSDEGRAIVEQIFLRLVTLGEAGEDTRRRVPRSELLAVGDDPDQIDELIDLYTASRLLATDIDRSTRSPTVELAHEAILHEWPRVRSWLDDSREDIRLQRALTSAAAEWREAEQDSSFLLRGTRLGQFENWSERSSLALTAKEKEFLAASVDAARAEEREKEAQIQRELQAAQTIRRRAYYLSGALIAAVGLAIAAVTFARSASSSTELAEQNLQAAQAANTQVVAEADIRATAEAVALLEQAESEIQAGIARSRELAAASVSVLDEDAELSMLLGLESIAALPPNIETSPSAVLALRDAMQSNRLVKRFPVAGGGPAWARITGDGSTIYASSSLDRSVSAIDVDSGSVLWTYRETDTLDSFARISLNPDETLVTVAIYDENSIEDDSVQVDASGRDEHPPRVVVLRASDGQVEAVLYPGACPAVGYWENGFSPDGRWLAIYTGTEACSFTVLNPFGDPAADWVAVYDTSTWEEAFQLSPERPPGSRSYETLAGAYMERVSWFPTSDRILLQQWAGPSELLTFPGLDLIRTYDSGHAIVSPDGEKMVLEIPDVSFPDVWMRVVDASTGEQLFNLDNRLFYWSFGGDIVSFSPDGSKVLLSTVDHDYVVDMDDGQLIADLGETGVTWSATFTEDGNRLLTSTTGSLMLWDLGGGVENLGIPIELEHAEAIWVNPNWALDRSRLAVQLFTSDGLSGYGFSIAVFDERTGAVSKELAALGTGLADGRFLVTPFVPQEGVRRAGPLAIWDPETDELIELTGCSALQGNLTDGSSIDCSDGERFFGNYSNLPSVASSSDGSFFIAESHALTGNPRLVRIWNAESLEIQFEYETLESEHVLDAGPTWIVAFDDNSFEEIIRDVTSGEVIQRLDNATYFPSIQEISPDGSVLYLTHRDDGWVEAYDTSTWELLASWEAHDVVNRGIAVSPDGRRLVTTSRGSEGLVKVWDVSGIRDRSSTTAPPPLLDRFPASFPSDAAWLADDRLVVFLAGARWYEVSLAVDDLVADVQSRLTRTFTVAECATYQIDPCPSLEDIKGSG